MTTLSEAQALIDTEALLGYLVRRYQCTAIERDDMLQVGRIGVIKAVRSYDETRGASFHTHARNKIMSEIRHHVRDHKFSIRIPAWLTEEISKISREAPQTVNDNEDDRETELRQMLITVESLDDFEDHESDRYLADNSQVFEPQLLHSNAVADILKGLTARDKRLLMLFYGEDYTLSDLAELYGATEPQVNTWIRTALKKVRNLAKKRQLQFDDYC